MGGRGWVRRLAEADVPAVLEIVAGRGAAGARGANPSTAAMAALVKQLDGRK